MKWKEGEQEPRFLERLSMRAMLGRQRIATVANMPNIEWQYRFFQRIHLSADRDITLAGSV